MISFFVTGTDTDAGKTHICRALLMAADARGMRAIGYKPIESGCSALNRPGPDALALAAAANTEPKTTYMLPEPIAPHLAAQRQGIQLELSTIVRQVRHFQETTDFLLVEGAGGFLVPTSAHENMADLATAAGLPILVVAPNRLGAINHTLLTIEAARHRNLEVAAVLLNDLGSASASLENHQSIAEFASVSVLGFPHTQDQEALAHHGKLLLDELLANTKT